MIESMALSPPYGIYATGVRNEPEETVFEPGSLGLGYRGGRRMKKRATGNCPHHALDPAARMSVRKEGLTTGALLRS